MVYDEMGSGGMIVSGCMAFSHVHYVITTYGPGDMLYNVHKARKGILEKIVIKKPRVVQSAKTYGLAISLYVDTLNALWNEDDLVTYDEAVDLATDYCEYQLSLLPSC